MPFRKVGQEFHQKFVTIFHAFWCILLVIYFHLYRNISGQGCSTTQKVGGKFLHFIGYLTQSLETAVQGSTQGCQPRKLFIMNHSCSWMRFISYFPSFLSEHRRSVVLSRKICSNLLCIWVYVIVYVALCFGKESGVPLRDMFETRRILAYFIQGVTSRNFVLRSFMHF